MYIRQGSLWVLGSFGLMGSGCNLTAERCQQLRLPLMVNENKTPHSTNFTVSIEAATGVTTGISAADRARTIQCAVAADAKPDDLVQPGHILDRKSVV